MAGHAGAPAPPAGAAGPEKGFSRVGHAVLTQSVAFSTDFSHLKPHCSSTSRPSIPACLHPSWSELSGLTGLAFKDSVIKSLCIAKKTEAPFNVGRQFCLLCTCSIIKLCSTLCNPIGVQHARLFCPPPSPGVWSMSIESVVLSNHLSHPL